jgi:hypothetical protein
MSNRPIPNVASELFATGITVGANLVAQIPQQGIYGYAITRVYIANGPQTDTVSGFLFRMYKGAPGTNQFSSTEKTDNNDAQFTPAEEIPAGCDVFGVWEGAGGYAGTATLRVITDGGY